ncbi:TrkA C-terminal domain-containing protein [Bacillus andreraoultii]|uniref:TrkA C-terminal domain-containing protein n=1 Tax=Bacillus andreraoultii TaxID=1499685 RepID=UPI00053B2D64|nr:TrkA C-terminal domain-containing protein [Bacillus andreraoultii]
MQVRTQLPAYQRIAIDIANRIYNEQLKVGERIYGRSTLASEYNVSPETIRKAIKILEDVEIVKSTKGSGVVITSRENAYKFIQSFSNMRSLKDLEKQMRDLLYERQQLDSELFDIVEKIIDYTGKLRNTNPLAPIEIEIPKGCVHNGKTIGEVNFWHNTGGTIVAIKRNEQVIVSPGPFATFQEGDILLIIGNDNVVQRVMHFLNE